MALRTGEPDYIVQEIRVRQATADDIPAVREVAGASWHHTYNAILSARAIEQFLSRAYSDYSLMQTLRKGGLFVLECSEHIVGYMRLGVSSGQGFLGAIYLLPEAQGKGYGGVLWARALEWFEARGLEDVLLTVAAENERARAFYRRLGFEETSECRSEIAGEPLVEITCHLRLTGSNSEAN